MPADERAVCVFGANDPRPGEAAYDQAAAVGRALAACGCTVVNGGYGGTMEASARGARAAGGRTIGVTCDAWTTPPNAFLDEEVRTATLLERLTTLIDLGRSGYVVLPGATGTLAELAFVWELLAKKLLTGRVLACLGGYWQPVIDLMTDARPSAAAYVRLVARPDDLRELFAASRPA
jgi:uncharacterized protein (TIGR00725 family)